MPKGPNSFFVAPDSELIINGTIYSSDDPTGLYPTTCVASTANSGSMSAFAIGNPASNTTYQFKIQDSGSNYSGTFIQRLSTASGSDQTLVWHGEPDRRFMWDIHNPILSMSSPGSVAPWNNAIRNDNINSIKGVYYSVLDKEFIYVSCFENNMPRLFVANRDIKNYENDWTDQGEITTLSILGYSSQGIYNLSAIDTNKRGMGDAYFPSYSICEHIDGKLKLAVKYNREIDIYESSDGINFTLIAKNILSRFVGKRFYRDLKIASSGPYLKIVFIGTDVGKHSSNEKERLTSSAYSYGPVSTFYHPLGGIVSSDGGATWSYTDEMRGLGNPRGLGGKITNLDSEDLSKGIEVPIVNNGYTTNDLIYDLCGLSDGSGKFVLVVGYRAVGNYGGAFDASFNAHPGTDKGYMRTYTSSANGKFALKPQLNVPNMRLSGKPFIASNNDCIWLITGGCYQPVNCGLTRLVRGSEWRQGYLNGVAVNGLPCDDYQYLQGNVPFPGATILDATRENSMFFLRIDADLNQDRWIPFGDIKVETNGGQFSNLLAPDGQWRIKSGCTTGSLGSYFFRPSSGNFYSCGPYMAFAALGKSSYGEKSRDDNDSISKEDLVSGFYFPQYYRFSGWLIRPPAINLGHDNIYNGNLPMVDSFSHQPQGVLSIAEFNWIWGLPGSYGLHQGNKISESTL